MPQSIVGAVESAAGNLVNTVETSIRNKVTSLTSLLSPQASAGLAPSIFSTGPRDNLLVRDIYGVVQGNPINNVERLLGGNSNNLISLFSAGAGIIGGLTGLLSVNANGISMNPSVLESRVNQAMRSFSGSYGSPCASTMNSILNQSSFAKNQFPTLSTSIGGILGSISTQNLADASCLINTVNALTGNTALASAMDVGAASVLLSVVMREAITMRVPGVVEALVSSSTNSEISGNALRANTAYAVQQCDIGTVTAIVAALGSGFVSSQVTNGSGQMLASYRFPAGSTSASYASLYAALQTTLTTVDPGWGTKMRNGVPISDLTPFENMSADAVTLFKSQNAYPVELDIADLYPSVGLIAQAKAQYPYMLIKAPSNTYVTTNPHS